MRSFTKIYKTSFEISWNFYKHDKKNGQKAAKNKYYLQMVNQLRRNVFNLDLKREIVAAKTNVKHFFLFNSHKYGTN